MEYPISTIALTPTSRVVNVPPYSSSLFVLLFAFPMVVLLVGSPTLIATGLLARSLAPVRPILLRLHGFLLLLLRHHVVLLTARRAAKSVPPETGRGPRLTTPVRPPEVEIFSA
jgi:hypothetical protein